MSLVSFLNNLFKDDGFELNRLKFKKVCNWKTNKRKTNSN